MDLDDIKRGLRAEIKKRKNEKYATFQCNVRQMCKDVLAKLEEQESEIVELKKQVHDYAQGLYVIQARAEKELRRQKYKRCLAMYHYCAIKALYELDLKGNDVEWKWYSKWMHKWFNLSRKFKDKEAK